MVDRTADGQYPPVLFPGDTLFVGGCGRFFEGTAAQMLNNMVRVSHYKSLFFCRSMRMYSSMHIVIGLPCTPAGSVQRVVSRHSSMSSSRVY